MLFTALRLQKACVHYFLLFLVVNNLFAQTNEQEKQAIAHLRDGIGARAKGIGGSFSAIADDVTATYWNPAGITSFSDTNVKSNITYTKFGEMSDYWFFGLVQKVPENWGAIGINWHYYKDGELINFDNQQNVFSIIYAREIELGLSTGFSVKYYLQRLEPETKQGMGLDLGIIYQPKESFVKLAFTIQDAISNFLKPTFRIGLSYPFIYEKFYVAVDIEKSIDLDKAKTHLGAEYKILQFLAIRAGLDGEFPALGIGISYTQYQLDYSYTNDAHKSQNYTHQISFGINF